MSAGTRRRLARYALFLTAYYVTNAVYQGYLSLFYNSLGFTSAQMGTIFAAVALVSMFTQPFWGMRGDRMRSRNALLRFLAAASLVSMLAFTLTSRYIPLLLLACLFSCFYTSIQPLGDSIILENLLRGNHPFGPIRLTAGMAFAFASLAFGQVLNAPGRESWSVYIIAGMCAVIFAATFLLPPTAGQQAAGGRRMSFGTLFRQRDLMKLMGFMAPLMITMGYFYTFFSPHFVSLEGGNSALLGWSYFISACSEIPFLLNSDRLFDRIGIGKLLCISSLALTARWLILGLTRNYVLVMCSQVFHGWGFIVITVGLAKYINLTVPAELRASGQLLLGAVSFGVARAVGNLGGGLLADAIGRQNVFFFSAAVCFLAFLVFGLYFLKREPLNGQAQ